MGAGKITELSDKILGIGEKVLETSPVHDMVESIHSGVVTKDFVGMFKKLHDITFGLINLKKSMGLKFPLTDAQMSSEDYNSYLALGLLEHDLYNKINATGYESYLATLSDDALRDEGIKEYEFRKANLLLYENIRVCASLVPYMINGDTKYLSNVKSKYVPDLIEALEEIYEPKCNYSISAEFIPSDEYFCVNQLVKNARKNLCMIKEEKNADFVPINIFINDKWGKTEISVEDHGSGISREKLPLIFGNFTDTEKGTGYGLQALKRLLDLRGGYGYVISKVEGENAYGYGISSGKTEELLPAIEKNGTRFNIYFSKLQS